jgi:hypothetical protein
MMARMVYVTCDRCFRPCGGTDLMADDAKEARSTARRMGWIRVNGEDICPDCA